MRASLLAIALCLASAGAHAQTPAKLVDSQSSVALERPGRPLRVAMPLGTAPSAAVARFLHVAGDRGARYASSLTWVWTTRRGWDYLECRAPLGFQYSAYPPGGQRWQVQVGREHCRPTHRGRQISEIRGLVHHQPRRISQREITQMSQLLEPPEPQVRSRRRWRRRARSRRVRRLSRREIRAMSRELE
jgi:hypothetical protein